jgi:hypothetical protein
MGVGGPLSTVLLIAGVQLREVAVVSGEFVVYLGRRHEPRL